MILYQNFKRNIIVSLNQSKKNSRFSQLVRPEHKDGLNPLRVSEKEWKRRIELAALCKSLHINGFGNDLAAQCAMGRIIDEKGENFQLHNEWGVFFEEVRASQHIFKIDWKGNIVDPFSQKRIPSNASKINMGCIPVANTIFNVRSDINFILHIHTAEIMAVSSTDCGLLPYSQASMFLQKSVGRYRYNFSYDPYFEHELGVLLRTKRILMLDHHGCYVVGKNAAEAFFLAFYFHQACDVQIKAMSMNTKLKKVSSENLNLQYDEMMTSEDYAYDGSREWGGILRKIQKEYPDFNM